MIGIYKYDFLRSEFIDAFISKFRISKGFERNAVSVVAPSNQNRQTSKFISGSNNAVFGQDQNGCGTVDQVLGMTNAGDQVFFLIDKRRN